MIAEDFQSIIEDLEYISTYIKAGGDAVLDGYEESIDDAIVMLQSDNDIKPKLTQRDIRADYKYYTVTCGACGKNVAEVYCDPKGRWGNMDILVSVPVNVGHKYCSYCGRKIDWSEILEVEG